MHASWRFDGSPWHTRMKSTRAVRKLDLVSMRDELEAREDALMGLSVA